jgi:hypothetical protein
MLDESTFYPLISFNSWGAWSQMFSNLIDMIGDEAFVEFKTRLNKTGVNFFRPGDASDPAKRKNGLQPRYADIAGKEMVIAQAISESRDAVLTMMGQPNGLV